MLLIALLYIPAVQEAISFLVSRQLGHILQTEVHIGRIDLGLFNRIILDDIVIKDRENKDMFKAARLAAKIKIIPLFHKQITLSNVQFYGFDINLYQKDAKSKPNFYFIIDAFKSDKPKKESTIPDLNINSILIRRGSVKFDRHDLAPTPGHFNPHHLDLHKISATISLKKLTKDTLNFNLKKLSFEEGSGLTLKQLKFKFIANTHQACLSDFEIAFPTTILKADSLSASYHFNQKAKSPKEMFKRLTFGGNPIKATVYLPDFAALNKNLNKINFPFSVSTRLSGTMNHIKADPVNIKALENGITLSANIMADNILDNNKRSLSATINKLSSKEDAINQILDTFVESPDKIKNYTAMAGDIELNGHLKASKNDIETSLFLHTSSGKISTEARLKDMKNFQARVFTDGLEIDSLVNSDLNHVAFDLNCRGTITKGQTPDLFLTGDINKLVYKKYPYQNIYIDGRYSSQGISGDVTINDPNIELSASGEFNMKAIEPYLRLNAQIHNFAPNTLHLTNKYENTRFGMQLDTDLKGKDIDLMNGHLKIENFSMDTEDEHYGIRNIHLESLQHETNRLITISSDFMQGSIKGNFRFKTLMHNGQKLLRHFIPTFIEEPKTALNGTDILSLNIDLYNVELLEKLLQIPLHINKPARIEGYFNSKENNLRFFTSVPSLTYNNQEIKDISLYSGLENDTLICGATLQKKIGSTPVEFNLRSRASHDQIQTKLYWDNHNTKAYKGIIDTNTHFTLNNQQELNTSIHFRPTQIVLNDSVWNIHSSHIEITPKRTDIYNFKIDHGERHLILNGTVSPHESDSLIANLKGINLEYIFNIVNFHTVDFGGLATGNVYATNLINSPFIDANLNVDKFTFNNALLGNLNIHGGFDKSNNRIFLDADIHDEPHQGHTQVKGDIHPGHHPGSGLELMIRTQNIDLAFLNRYTSGIFTNMQGRASGWTRVFGPFGGINIEGDMFANSAQMTVNATNVTYHLVNDSIILRPGNIYFKDAVIYDQYGYPNRGDHYAIVNGKLQHDHFSNMRFDFNIDAYNILGYDQKDFGDEAFCGTAFATGRLAFNGRPGVVNINIDVRPEENTVFTYNLSSPTTLTSNQFITYKQTNTDTTTVAVTPKLPLPETTETDIRLNFNLDITPEATMKILMDPKAGDYIAVNGHGNIRANYYNKGAFNMYGTYTVDNGIYKLSLQDVIRKDFIFSPGGTITFSGNPTNAALNLQAIYTVPSVSLNDLSTGSTFSQNNVRVNCIMNLTGKATAPNIGFDFDLPTVNEDEKQMVKSLISTEEEKNMQVIYLLGIGRFYTYDYQNTEQSQSSVAMKSLLSSTLSGQLNQMLSSIIGNNSNWNIGTNLSTGEQGWSDMDVEGLLSGRLLNNRLLINGNFGYRDNTTTTSNFIGDFDIQWLLTPNGNVSLKAYSKTNDRYFTKSSLTTQGIGVAIKKDFGSWRDIFRYFIPKKKRQTGKEKQNTSK